ncbi:hypothetical protein LV779_34955 [Streptomyces thinghirensis]|nr:hypothetical protein [Streptomyces thinghirensis]
MYFDADGTIRRVQMQVRDNFADGNALGWKTYGGSWSAGDGRYRVNRSQGGKALLDTNFADFTQGSRRHRHLGRRRRGPGLPRDPALGRPWTATPATTRASAPAARWSWAGRTTTGQSWAPPGCRSPPALSHRLRVTAVGSSIKVYVDDMTTPRISVTDGTYRSGASGVRVFDAAASFDNVAVSPAQ